MEELDLYQVPSASSSGHCAPYGKHMITMRQASRHLHLMNMAHMCTKHNNNRSIHERWTVPMLQIYACPYNIFL